MSDVAQDPKVKADLLGLRLVRPTQSQVFVDIDSEEALETFQRQFELLLTFAFRLDLDVDKMAQITPSQTPGHYHVVVECSRALTAQERIMLQALLGSDLKRELLGLKQIAFGLDEDASVFFEK